MWRGGEEGLEVAIICPPMVIGSGDWQVFPSFVLSVYKGLSYYPTGSIGVVDVRDIAAMCAQLVERQVWPSNRYICCAENWTLEHISQSFAEALGVVGPKQALQGIKARLSIKLLPIIQFFGAYKNIPATFLEYAQMKYEMDASLSEEELAMHYRPIRSSIQEIAHQFLETYPQGIKKAILPIN